MQISLSPSMPALLHIIPTKYKFNILIHLWTHAFHRLLEALQASFTSTLALKHLQDFIYFTYTFYTSLLEEPTLCTFYSGWLEALRDLAHYHMAIAAMVTNSQSSGASLTTDALSKATAASKEPTSKPAKSQVSSSDHPAAYIDDSPTPSTGIATACIMEIRPDMEWWRGVAKEWYSQGLAEAPGTSKLHQHLELLSWEVKGEELRYFVKRCLCLPGFI